MARLSNIDKAFNEIVNELSSVQFNSAEEGAAALTSLVEKKCVEYNLDATKKAQLQEKIESKKAEQNETEIKEDSKTETSTQTEAASKPQLTLEQRVTRMEQLLSKLAHYNGTQAIIREFGLEPWTPGKKDMSKFN